MVIFGPIEPIILNHLILLAHVKGEKEKAEKKKYRGIKKIETM